MNRLSNPLSRLEKRLIRRFSEYSHLETGILHFGLAMTLLTLAGGLVSAFLTVAMRQSGASFVEIGLVATLYNVALAVSAFFGGSLSRRYGGKKVFAAALLFNLAGMIFYGSTTIAKSWILIASGLLLGRIALGLRDTSSFSIVSGMTEEKRKATVFGLLYAFSFVGSIVASTAAGAIASCFSYTVLFVIAIPFVVAAIVIVFLKLEKSETSAERSVPSWKELREALTIEKNVTFLLFIALWEQFFAEFGNPYYLIFMQEKLAAPEYLLPMTQITFSVSSLIAGLSVGYFSDIMKKRKPFVVVAILLASVGAGLTTFSGSPYMMLIVYFLFGFSNVMGFTCLQAYFSEVGKARGSLIWGTYTAFLWIGGISSPFMSGLIAEAHGLRASFLITTSGMAIEAFLLLIFFKEKRRS